MIEKNQCTPSNGFHIILKQTMSQTWNTTFWNLHHETKSHNSEKRPASIDQHHQLVFGLAMQNSAEFRNGWKRCNSLQFRMSTFLLLQQIKNRNGVQYVERLRSVMIFPKTFWMFTVNTRVVEKFLNEKNCSTLSLLFFYEH